MDIGSTKSHEHASTANERYAQDKTRRDEHVSKVLSSTAERKVVVAGPGTGKTYLFKKLLVVSATQMVIYQIEWRQLSGC
jgi:hypothetical protein